jgi:hypothetical protein
MGACRREIVVDDDLAAVLADQDEIVAALLERRVEQKLRIRHRDDVAPIRLEVDLARGG